MKKHLPLIIALLLALPLRAHDFSAPDLNGNTLYYDIIGNGVSIVYPVADAFPINGWGTYTRPTGAVVIPSQVIHNDTIYPVVSIAHHAFFCCDGITSIVLPETISHIGNSAFSRCTALASATLPYTLDSLPDMAFGYCANLTHLTIHRSLPPYTSPTAFEGCHIDSCTLHIACGSLNNYNTTAPWSNFLAITDAGCQIALSTNPNYTSRGTTTGDGLYPPNTTVTIAAWPAEGHFFACWSDGDTLNPRTILLTTDSHFTALLFPLQHDTLLLPDTISPTLLNLQVLTDDPSRGIGVGSTNLPTGSRIEICALPIGNNQFAGWSDGSPLNPRTITLDSNTVLTAHFSSAALPEPPDESRLTLNGQTLIIDTPRPLDVNIYDITGRLLIATHCPHHLTIPLPHSGTYLVKLGNNSARKLVVCGK